MQDLSREAILRMVGLHDAAQFMRQINAIQLSLEEQNGQMVAYWTEIRKDERQITLVAGRVSANETSIGQLQVTATSLTASVSSLNTTVNGDGTQGSGLVSQVSSLSLTVGNINLSVQSLSTTVNGDGTQGSGLVSRVSSLELTESSISQRVSVIEGDYVKEAEISLMVKKDGNGYISNANIKADRIDFTFTQSTNFNSGGQTVMNIDSSGNLWIAGEYKGGSITGNITVGTGTKKMYIEPTSSGARLVGKSGDTETLSLGFYDGTSSHNAQLRFGSSHYSEESLQVRSTDTGSLGTIDVAADGLSGPEIHITYNGSSGLVRFIFQAADKYVILRATGYGYDTSKWPQEGVDNINSLGKGTVYLRSDGCLGVKQ